MLGNYRVGTDAATADKCFGGCFESVGGAYRIYRETGMSSPADTGVVADGGEIEMPASVSSQYVSALMMIAPYMANGLKIKLVGKIVSRTYIEMTRHIMEDFGAKVAFPGNRKSGWSLALIPRWLSGWNRIGAQLLISMNCLLFPGRARSGCPDCCSIAHRGIPGR